jgi:prepilin-type N-terminal cleavage/methylation domain-containing protein/prepilin-type processing-associated H-X9-DG protein
MSNAPIVRKYDRQSGFTLIELLVVVGVIMVLIGLLLPAAQTAREAARRVDCTTKLKQLGLGIAQYHDAFGCIPWGRVVSFDVRFVGVNPPCTAKHVDKSFLVSIAPFLEHSDLVDSLNSSLSVLSVENATLHSRMPGLYVCPSDPLAGRVLRFTEGETGVPIAATQVQLTSYVGNFGVVAVIGFPAAFSDCRVPNQAIQQINGVLNDLHPLRWADVTDGLLMTALASERLAAPLETFNERADSKGPRHGWWFTGNLGDTLYVASFPPNAFDRVNYGNGTAVMMNPSSNHAGGANLLRCDGSVSFVGASIDSWRLDETTFKEGWYHGLPAPGLWQTLHTRNGNEANSALQ